MIIRKKKPKVNSTLDTRIYAVNEVLENHRTNREVADELGVHIHSIRQWVNNFKRDGDAGLASKQSHLLPVDQAELERLRIIERKYYEQQTENEILKKFQAFLKENENKKHMKP